MHDLIGGSILPDWARATTELFSNWASDAVAIFTGWFDDVVALFARLISIEFAWPTIPNPFKDIDFCKYIPEWVKKAMGICGESKPEPHEKAAPHEKTDPHDKHGKSHSKGHEKTPHVKAHDKHDKDHSKGYIKTPHVKVASYHTGGSVTDDGPAELQKGEWVVPKGGQLIRGGGTDKPHVKVIYNIGPVYGVADLEELLRKHDRDLYKKLKAMI